VSFQLNLNTETVDHCHPRMPLCVAPTESVGEAMRLMKEGKRGAVVVCRDRVVVGVFTERDALKLMVAGAGFDEPIMRFMTRDPVVVRADDKVGKAITLMAKGGYRRLPIVDERGRVTGIIKIRSILHYLVEHFPSVIYTLPPEPHQKTETREGA
jgi:CBS domain-containing protein